MQYLLSIRLEFFPARSKESIAGIRSRKFATGLPRRSDIILLLFDPYKLDISDEFKSVIHALRGHDDKVRVVLNKADQVSEQQLLRVYSALMWSLGKVFMTPEVCKVYVGSFNTEPIRTDVNKMHEIFQMEHEALLNDLMNIPAKSCDRKVNEFVKRTRALRSTC